MEKGGMKKEVAEWEDTPCSCCTLNDDSPNNQGQTFVSLDSMCGDNGDDFDSAETLASSEPLTIREKVVIEIMDVLITAGVDNETIATCTKQIQAILDDTESLTPEFTDWMNNGLDVFGYISRLPATQKRAVEWKLNDPNTAFTELADELGCTPQYCNQEYLEALKANPVLGHVMKNRSSKVERYKSHHVVQAQGLGNLLTGLCSE